MEGIFGICIGNGAVVVHRRVDPTWRIWIKMWDHVHESSQWNFVASCGCGNSCDWSALTGVRILWKDQTRKLFMWVLSCAACPDNVTDKIILYNFFVILAVVDKLEKMLIYLTFGLCKKDWHRGISSFRWNL